jgi:hypothetical protein
VKFYFLSSDNKSGNNIMTIITPFTPKAPKRIIKKIEGLTPAAVERSATMTLDVLTKATHALNQRISQFRNNGFIYLAASKIEGENDIVFLDAPPAGRPYIRLTVEETDLRANPKIPQMMVDKLTKRSYGHERGYESVFTITQVDPFGSFKPEMEESIRNQIALEANLNATGSIPQTLGQPDMVADNATNKEWCETQRQWVSDRDPQHQVIYPRGDGSILRREMDVYEIGLLKHLLYEASHTHLRELAETQPEIDLTGMAVARTSIQTVSDFFNPTATLGHNMVEVMPALTNLTQSRSIYLKVNPASWEAEVTSDRKQANAIFSTSLQGLADPLKFPIETRNIILQAGMSTLQLITAIYMANTLFTHPHGQKILKKLAIALNIRLCEGLLHSIWQRAANEEKHISQEALESLQEELHEIANSRELKIDSFGK